MIGAAIKKDIWLLLRDRGALISLFLLPIIFIVAFGSMFKFGPDQGKPRDVPFYAAAGDPRGETIFKALGASEGFVPVRMDSADAVRAEIAAHDGAGLIVPSRSSNEAGNNAGNETAPPPPVELVIDLGAPMQVRAPLQGALTSVVMRAMAPIDLSKLPPMVEAKTPPGIAKPLANISAFQVTVPGNAVLFGFFIALTCAMAFVNERKIGTWRRLLAAPVPRYKALLAGLVPYYLVGCLQLAFLFTVGIVVFGMRVAGSPIALIALSMSVTACAVSLGLLFAAVARTEKQLGGVGSVVLLVMGMLGGCMFPRLVMPPFMKTLGLGVPHGWALDGYYAVLVREGTTIADIAPSIAALLGFAAVFAILGVALFRFEK